MFGNGSNIRIISNQRFWEKQAEAFGKRFLNFERMGTVEISSSRAPKKWYNERVKGRQMRTKRECRRYFAVYAAYAKACAKRMPICAEVGRMPVKLHICKGFTVASE